VRVKSFLLRIVVWFLGGIVSIGILWVCLNRFGDQRPDPRIASFLKSTESEVPDDKNMAIGVLGLNAPRGVDVMAHGVAVKELYRQYLPWSEIQRKIHGPGALELTVTSEQITCWVDPDRNWGIRGCLPFEKAPSVLADNRELLNRYKSLYSLEKNSHVGIGQQTLLTLSKLAVAEMRLDMRQGNYELAYKKWRDQFRFLQHYMHGQNDWVGVAIGLVLFGYSFPVIEDLLVRRPDLAITHFDELLALLRPEGIDLINPQGVARTEFRLVDQYLLDPSSLAARVWQPNRVRNRYLAFWLDYLEVLRRPWPQITDQLVRMRGQYESSFGWGDVIDPFGSAFLSGHIYWQLKPTELLRQVFVIDGKMRIATSIVRMIHSHVPDDQIAAYLANVGPDLYDPFTQRPMQWDPANSRAFFQSEEDKCWISYVRVPVWDTKSKRKPPKPSDAKIC
jgi:hypothetical protein